LLKHVGDRETDRGGGSDQHCGWLRQQGRHVAVARSLRVMSDIMTFNALRRLVSGRRRVV
jgi:hypothetical protein